VAHDIALAQFQSAIRAEEDIGDTLDVSHLQRHVLVELGLAQVGGIFGDIERFVRGLRHLSIFELLHCRFGEG